MLSTRRWFLRGLVAAVAATALPMPATRVAAAQSMPTTTAQAPGVRQMQGGTWIQLSPGVPVSRLFAPASGALFASTADALLRSDDAGANWRPVDLPAPRKADAAVQVDPTDHRVIYADTDAGLQRTDDDGATWTNILPTDRRTHRVAMSPADPRVLYVPQRGSFDADFFLMRSLDRGATWDTAEEFHNSMCGWGVPILAPHPTDPARIFRSAGCHAGRDLSDDLEESRDNGSTWRKLFSPKGSFPQTIVGGSGAEPSRLYLASNNDYRGGGSLVFTSADDGATWTPILEYKGGGTMLNDKLPNISMGGLTYDPAAPSHVFVGLRRNIDHSKPADSLGVVATTDGGAAWSQLGQAEIPEVKDLALGIDGRNLFAATAGGVWRFGLG